MTVPLLGMWYPRLQHFKFGSPVIDGSLILQGPPAGGQGIGFVVKAPRAGFVRGFGYLPYLQQGSGAIWNFGTWRTTGGLPSLQIGTGNVTDAQLPGSGVWHDITFPLSMEVERDEPIACTIVAGTPGPISVYGAKYILGPANYWLAAPYIVTKADSLSPWVQTGSGIGETLPALALIYFDGYEVPFGCQPAIALGTPVLQVMGHNEEAGFGFRPPFGMTVDGLSFCLVQDGTSVQARLYDNNRVLLREGPLITANKVFDTDAEYLASYFEPIELDAGRLYYCVLHSLGANNKLHGYEAPGPGVLDSMQDGGVYYVSRGFPIGPFSDNTSIRMWAGVHIGAVTEGGEEGGPGIRLFFNPCPQECPDDPAPATGQVVAPAGVSGALGLPSGCGSPFIVTPCDPTYPA